MILLLWRMKLLRAKKLLTFWELKLLQMTLFEKNFDKIFFANSRRFLVSCFEVVKYLVVFLCFFFSQFWIYICFLMLARLILYYLDLFCFPFQYTMRKYIYFPSMSLDSLLLQMFCSLRSIFKLSMLHVSKLSALILPYLWLSQLVYKWWENDHGIFILVKS